MGAATAGAIVAPIVGGMIGADQARGDERAASRARQAALAQFLGIDVPTVAEQEVDFLLPEFMGEYAPQTEEVVELGPTAMEGIALDPELRAAQMEALQGLSEIGEAGLTPGDVAAMRSLQRQVAGQEQARQEAILQEMARRGVAGSGQELAARLQSSQSAADRASEEANRMAQMAQARALEGITRAGSLGGQIRGQEFGEQADVATARDAISRFNAANQQSVRQRNVQAQQQAQLRNLQEQQRIAEQQTATKNLQQQYNKELIQQRFQNRMNRAAGAAGQYGGIAEDRSRAAQRTADMWAGIGRGVGTGIGAFAGRSKDDD